MRCASSISRITASRKLAFFAGVHSAPSTGERLTPPASQQALLAHLEALRFLVTRERESVEGVAGLTRYYAKMGEQRAGLPFDIDGVVL